MARISCQNQLILDTWRAYLATNRRFSCPRSLWECIRAQSCHRQTPGNAFREHLAAAEQPRTRRGHVRIPECIGGCGCGGGAGGRCVRPRRRSRGDGGIGAASERAAGALPRDGGGTRTATWGRGGGAGRRRRRRSAGAALARHPLSAETAGRRHALRQGGTAAAGVRCVRAAGMRSNGMKPPAGGDTSCGGNCATRVRMNPFTPTFFRCGTVIKIICYATNK